MSSNKKHMTRIIIGLVIVLIVAVVAVYITSAGRRALNRYGSSIQKADDETSYATRKEVEDTCRSLIVSYKADALRYEQYKESDAQKDYAEQAKMRANKTAILYNEYILKNSFVFEGNVPADILDALAYIE